MRFKYLAKKQENGCICHLIETSLEEYINNIPVNYAEYDIQRSIVNNIYLDKLVETVLNRWHIPTITLITENIDDYQNTNNVSDIKILDGLQRTHRLKSIYETKEFFIKNKAQINELESEFQIKRKYREELSRLDSNGAILYAIKNYCDQHGEQELDKCFTDNNQWFELWCGLSPEQEVRKMLILNAGHKPVNIRHQLELLFQNIYPIFESVKNGSIKLLREKEVSSINSSKTRTVGTYQFSHLISALLSFVEAKPITTNTNLISKIQDDEKTTIEYSKVFSYEFLERFINSVYKLDEAIYNNFGDKGLKWFGRDVTLVSLFAALGKRKENNHDYINDINKLCLNISKLNIPDYEDCRNNVDLAKVNIGNINKKFILQGITEFIQTDMQFEIEWKKIFNEGNDE